MIHHKIAGRLQHKMVFDYTKTNENNCFADYFASLFMASFRRISLTSILKKHVQLSSE